MGLLRALKVVLANSLRGPRASFLESQLLPGVSTILDIGCSDLYFTDRLRGLGYEVVPTDLEPRQDGIERCDIMDTGYDDGAFDAVVALEVVEHVPDPVKALHELRRVARRQLIISVPNEPWFSFWRFMTWETGHFWAIAWPGVHHHLGRPDVERTVVLGRYRYFIWNDLDRDGDASRSSRPA